MSKFTFQKTDFINEDLLSVPFWSISKNPYEDQPEYSLLCGDSPESIYCSKRDLIYMEMAKVWSKNSHCQRMQVGCLIVNNKSIISDGYNGTPTGFPNKCETEDNVTSPLVLHAEANAITKLAKGTQSAEGSVVYVTLSPCFECSKLIIQSGIKKVVFLEVYRNREPIHFLLEAGIELIKLTL